MVHVRTGVWCVAAFAVALGGSAASAEPPEPSCQAPSLAPDSLAIPSNSPGFSFGPGLRLLEYEEVPLGTDGLRVTRAGGEGLAFEQIAETPGDYRFTEPLEEGEVIHFEAPDGCSHEGRSWTRDVTIGALAPIPTSLPEPEIHDTQEGDVVPVWEGDCFAPESQAGVAVPFSVEIDEGLRPWLPLLRFTTEVDGEPFVGSSPILTDRELRDHVMVNCESPRISPLAEGIHDVRVKVEMIASGLVLRTASVQVELRCSEDLMRTLRREQAIRSFERSLEGTLRYLYRSGWGAFILVVMALMIGGAVVYRRHRRRPDWTKAEDVE